MKLSNLSKLAAITILGSLFTACATAPYVPTIYDGETAQVKSIAIADDSLPERMGANELASAAGTGQAAGGLIGLLVVSAIEGAETSGRMKKLNEMMEPLGFDAEAEFESILKTKLAAAGYSDLSVVGGERKKRVPLTEKTLPETSADAILDVTMVSFGVQNVPQTEGFITMAPAADSVGYMKIKEMDPEVVRSQTMNMLNEIADTIVTLL